MIHQYINNGYHIILDVNSGSVHAADQLFYDVVEVLSSVVKDMEKPQPLTGAQKQVVMDRLSQTYPAEELQRHWKMSRSSLMRKNCLPLTFTRRM